jgi:DHA1 family inner membrane transport protein
MFTLYTYISRFCIPSPTPSAVCHRDAGADWRRLFAGQLSGGKFADRSVSGTLKGFLLLLMVIMLAIPLLAQSQVGAAISMVVWGAATFAVVPPLQMRVMRVAHEAPGLSSSVNIGAFNLGNALGAAAGGAVILWRPGLCVCAGDGGDYRGRGAAAGAVQRAGAAGRGVRQPLISREVIQ